MMYGARPLPMRALYRDEKVRRKICESLKNVVLGEISYADMTRSAETEDVFYFPALGIVFNATTQGLYALKGRKSLHYVRCFWGKITNVSSVRMVVLDDILERDNKFVLVSASSRTVVFISMDKSRDSFFNHFQLLKKLAISAPLLRIPRVTAMSSDNAFVLCEYVSGVRIKNIAVLSARQLSSLCENMMFLYQGSGPVAYMSSEKLFGELKSELVAYVAEQGLDFDVAFFDRVWQRLPDDATSLAISKCVHGDLTLWINVRFTQNEEAFFIDLEDAHPSNILYDMVFLLAFDSFANPQKGLTEFADLRALRGRFVVCFEKLRDVLSVEIDKKTVDVYLFLSLFEMVIRRLKKKEYRDKKEYARYLALIETLFMNDSLKG